MDVYLTTSPDDTFSPLISINVHQQASNEIAQNGELGEFASSPFVLPSPTVNGAWVVSSPSQPHHSDGIFDGLALAPGMPTTRSPSISNEKNLSLPSLTKTLPPSTGSGGSLVSPNSENHGIVVGSLASTGGSRDGYPRRNQIIPLPRARIQKQSLPMRDGKALPKSDATWARYRPIITALYSNKALRLKDLQRILNEEYGFDAR
jgi:hypothetical protein